MIPDPEFSLLILEFSLDKIPSFANIPDPGTRSKRLTSDLGFTVGEGNFVVP